uniref:Uncharacterized protein AlNc14C434G11612 n=1 Tax=Albugo laibachii Nc14 TaxID=890382 RepID=F0WZM0_9STRA|nr:conserved hypothetical protein [Albugo laibachii Nc14]|eukprot:CCA26945.1 conserved hypothetical protein [Albugo laibachii Nc14]
MLPCYLETQKTYTLPYGAEPLSIASTCDEKDPASIRIAAIYLPNRKHASSAALVLSFALKSECQHENVVTFTLCSPSLSATFALKSWKIAWSSHARNLLVSAIEIEAQRMVGPRFWIYSSDTQFGSRYRLNCTQIFSTDILGFQWHNQATILSQFGLGEKEFLLVSNDAKIVYLRVEEVVAGKLVLDARKWHARLVSCAFHRAKGTLALSGDIQATESQPQGASSWSLWKVPTHDFSSTSMELLDSTLILDPTGIEYRGTLCGSIVDQSFIDGGKLCMVHGEGHIAIRELEICENVIPWRRVLSDPTAVIDRATFLTPNLLVFESNSHLTFTTASLEHLDVFGIRPVVCLTIPEPHGRQVITFSSEGHSVQGGIRSCLCIHTLITEVFGVIAALTADNCLDHAVDLLEKTSHMDPLKHDQAYQHVWEMYCHHSSSAVEPYRIVLDSNTQQAAFRALQNVQSDTYVEEQSLRTATSSAESMERMLRLGLKRASGSAASQLARWLYRLETMKLLAVTQAEWYDARWYLEFRDIDLVDLAMRLASSGEIDALAVLWARNKWNLVRHRLSILACLPFSPRTHIEWIPVIAPDDAVFHGLNTAKDIVTIQLDDCDNKTLDLSDQELQAISAYASLSYTHRLEQLASAFSRLFLYWDETFGQLGTAHEVLELLPAPLSSHPSLVTVRDAIRQLYAAEYCCGLSLGIRVREWQTKSLEERMRLVLAHPHVSIQVIRSIFLTGTDRKVQRKAVDAFCMSLVDQKPLCVEMLMDPEFSRDEKKAVDKVLSTTLQGDADAINLACDLLRNCPVESLGSLLSRLRQLEIPHGLDLAALEHLAPNERYTRLQLGLSVATDDPAYLEALCASSLQASPTTPLDDLQIIAYHHLWILHSFQAETGIQPLLLYWKEHIKLLNQPQLAAFLFIFREFEKDSPHMTELKQVFETQLHSSTRMDTLSTLVEACPNLQIDRYYEDATYRINLLESLATQQNTYSIAVSYAAQFDVDPYTCLLAYIRHAFKTSQPLQPFEGVHPIQEALAHPNKLVPFLLGIYDQLSGTDYKGLILVFRLLLECFKRLQKTPSTIPGLTLSDACYRRWTLLFVCLKRLKELSDGRIDFKLMAEREDGHALMQDTCSSTHSVALEAVLPFVSAQNIKLISKMLLQLHQIPVSSFVLLYMDEMCGRMQSAADVYEACYPFLPVLSDEDLVSFYDAFVSSMISSKQSTKLRHLQRVGDQLTREKQLEVRVDLVSRIRGCKDEKMKKDVLLNALCLLQRNVEAGWMQMILQADPVVEEVLACLKEKKPDQKLDPFLRIVRGMPGVEEAQIMVLLMLLLCVEKQDLQVCWFQERLEMVLQMLTDTTIQMASGWQTHDFPVGEPAFLYSRDPPEMKELLQFLEWSHPRPLDAAVTQVFTQVQVVFAISKVELVSGNEPLAKIVQSRWLRKIANCVDTNFGDQGLMLAQALLLHYRVQNQAQRIFDLQVDGISTFKHVYFALACQVVAGSETIQVELDLEERVDKLLRCRPEAPLSLNTIAGLLTLHDVLQGETWWKWEQEVEYATRRQLIRLVQKQEVEPESSQRGSCWDRLLKEQGWSFSDWITWYKRRAYGREQEGTIESVIENSESNSFAAHVALLCPFPNLRARFHGQIVAYCVSCARGEQTEPEALDLMLLRYDLKELLEFDVVIYPWVCRGIVARWKDGKEDSICSSMEYLISAAIASGEVEIAGRLVCAFRRVHPSLYSFDVSQILLQRWSLTFEKALTANRAVSEPVQLLLAVVTSNNELLKQ